MSVIESHAEMGTVQSLYRYPVKSMLGEELTHGQVYAQGFFGDRVCALLDSADGKIATAKNPQKWPNLFAFQAAFMDPVDETGTTPYVRITLPDGKIVTTQNEDVNQVLSHALNRAVRLVSTVQRGTSVRSELLPSTTAQSEEYWPDIEGRDKRNTLTNFPLFPGTFFDSAVVHLLTTSTLNQLKDMYPEDRFQIQRFRPNLVVKTGEGHQGFVENEWIGRTLCVGKEVQLHIRNSCARCVMTTLAQGDLTKDPMILRTAVQYNQGNVGVYAAVVQGGIIHRGDRIRLEF